MTRTFRTKHGIAAVERIIDGKAYIKMPDSVFLQLIDEDDLVNYMALCEKQSESAQRLAALDTDRAEREAAEHQAKFGTLDAYLATLSPLRAGKERQALMKQVAVNGEFELRCVHAERMAALDCYSIQGDRLINTRTDCYLLRNELTATFFNYFAYLRGQPKT